MAQSKYVCEFAGILRRISHVCSTKSRVNAAKNLLECGWNTVKGVY